MEKTENNTYERGTKRPFITDTASANINIRNRQFPISMQSIFHRFTCISIWTTKRKTVCFAAAFLIPLHFLILCCFLFACATIYSYKQIE